MYISIQFGNFYFSKSYVGKTKIKEFIIFSQIMVKSIFSRLVLLEYKEINMMYAQDCINFEAICINHQLGQFYFVFLKFVNEFK